MAVGMPTRRGKLQHSSARAKDPGLVADDIIVTGSMWQIDGDIVVLERLGVGAFKEMTPSWRVSLPTLIFAKPAEITTGD